MDIHTQNSTQLLTSHQVTIGWQYIILSASSGHSKNILLPKVTASVNIMKSL